MWFILAKYGVPDFLVNVIKSLYENMQVGISLENLANTEVSNGLRQGCVLAHTLLFNVVI